MIKYILFDLDETLFDFPKAERAAISEVMSVIGISPSEDRIRRYSEINRECWDALERGEMSRERLVIFRFEKFLAEQGSDFSPEEAQKQYVLALGAQHHFIDGAEELLSLLSEKYELYAVTNGLYAVQTRRIKDSRLDRFFKGYFISEEIGFSKPQKEFFDLAFSKIDGFERDKAIIIGDSLQSDILGGKNAGIRTCHYNPQKKENKTGIIPDHEIKNLSELPRLLKEL
jgi:2-haloacid dehalogenase